MTDTFKVPNNAYYFLYDSERKKLSYQDIIECLNPHEERSFDLFGAKEELDRDAAQYKIVELGIDCKDFGGYAEPLEYRIIEHMPTGRFFKFEAHKDSWHGDKLYGGDYEDIYEVIVETKKVYVRK